MKRSRRMKTSMQGSVVITVVFRHGQANRESNGIHHCLVLDSNSGHSFDTFFSPLGKIFFRSSAYNIWLIRPLPNVLSTCWMTNRLLYSL